MTSEHFFPIYTVLNRRKLNDKFKHLVAKSGKCRSIEHNTPVSQSFHPKSTSKCQNLSHRSLGLCRKTQASFSQLSESCQVPSQSLMCSAEHLFPSGEDARKFNFGSYQFRKGPVKTRQHTHVV